MKNRYAVKLLRADAFSSNRKLNLSLRLAAAALLVVAVACNQQSAPPEKAPAAPPATLLTVATFQPVPLPDPKMGVRHKSES